jgi:hypothetical protein
VTGKAAAMPTSVRIRRGAHWPWDYRIEVDGETVCGTDDDGLKLLRTILAAVRRDAPVQPDDRRPLVKTNWFDGYTAHLDSERSISLVRGRREDGKRAWLVKTLYLGVVSEFPLTEEAMNALVGLHALMSEQAAS